MFASTERDEVSTKNLLILLINWDLSNHAGWKLWRMRNKALKELSVFHTFRDIPCQTNESGSPRLRWGMMWHDKLIFGRGTYSRPLTPGNSKNAVESLVNSRKQAAPWTFKALARYRTVTNPNHFSFCIQENRLLNLEPFINEGAACEKDQNR